MIKAGNVTIQDKGFVVNMETLGGVNRQVLMLELSGGVTDEELTALCENGIEVLDTEGNTVTTYPGAFRVVSHRIKLARENESEDVATLSAKLQELSGKLLQEQTAKETAQNALAMIQEELAVLKTNLVATLEEDREVEE